MRKRQLTEEAKLLLLLVFGLLLLGSAAWLFIQTAKMALILKSAPWFLVIASDFKGNSHLFLRDKFLEKGEMFDAGNRYVAEDCSNSPIPEEEIPFVVDSTRPLTDEESEELGKFPSSFEDEFEWLNLL